jgi:hypothetical protein
LDIEVDRYIIRGIEPFRYIADGVLCTISEPYYITHDTHGWALIQCGAIYDENIGFFVMREFAADGTRYNTVFEAVDAFKKWYEKKLTQKVPYER